MFNDEQGGGVSALPAVSSFLGKAALVVAALPSAMAMMTSTAHAVPAFARQTGQECAACHVGSFGPQLTSYGRNFKLNGYVWGPNKSGANGLSGMAFGGYEHTSKKFNQVADGGASGPITRFRDNDNVTVDQASLFYGGRLLDTVGLLAQVTYSDPSRHFGWDNTDVRYADTGTVLGTDILWGATLNNNPSVQDVWQTTPGWGFPFLSSTLAPAPAAKPFMTGLGGTVAGAGAYTLWNDLVYLEATGYKSLSNDLQRRLAGSSGANRVQDVSPYWRLALQHDFGMHYVSIGTFGMENDVYPGGAPTHGHNHYLDYAVDATYQATLAGGDHIVSLYATAMRENQRLNATFGTGGSSNLHDNLVSLQANGSYYFHNIAGITLKRFVTYGSQDDSLYGSQRNHRPNNAGWTAQLDFTPFGKQDSFGFPFLNARFFIQYTAYDKFNGSKDGYDAAVTGMRKASDNNTIYAGTWLAF